VNPWLMQLINQGLIHGPKIPQYAQNVVRGGQKVASGIATKLPQYAQSLQNYMFNTGINKPQGNIMKYVNPGRILSAAPPTFATQYLTDPELMKQEAVDVLDISESISEGLGNKINSLFDKDIIKTKKVKKKKKKKKERLESRERQRKLKKEPTTEEGWHIPETSAEGGLIEMKKGGHAKKKKKGYTKKQRKRKHYMASGFVKMKKKKKYIT